MTFTFNALKVELSGESFSFNGSYAYSESVSYNEEIYTSTGSIKSLTFEHTVGSDTRSTTLRDYSSTYTDDDTKEKITLTFKGTIDDSVIGGGIKIKTQPPFEFGYSDSYPSKGSVKITGEDKSSVTLTALEDGVRVKLETDADGDGTPDGDPVYMNWTELEAQSGLAPL